MDTPPVLPLVFQHLLVSLIPWLVGLLLGSLVGYGLAVLLRKMVIRRPRRLHWLALLPWRSLVAWTALVLVYSPAMEWRFGLGTRSAAVAVGAAITLLSIPWLASMLLNAWFPRSTLVKVLAMLRMSAILAIVLTVFLKAGMGYYLWYVTENLNIPALVSGYQVVGLLLLAVDLFFGLVQFLIVFSQGFR